MPNAETLYRFCDYTGTNADYILFGGPAPYRGQSRDTQDLELDLVVAVLRGVAAKGAALPPQRLADLWLIPSRLVDYVVSTIESEIGLWDRYFEEVESLSQGITRVALAQDSVQRTQPKIAKDLEKARAQLHDLASRLVPNTQIIRGVELVSPDAVAGTPENAMLGYYGIVPEGAVLLGRAPENDP